jgi:hypothetical protein
MPSVQQLRWEAFADAAENARRSRLLEAFGGHNAREAVEVRLETDEGVSLECRLLEVDLDRRELVGRVINGRSLVLPLPRVRAVWHKRRRTGRALSIWFATLAACATAGGALGSTATARGSVTTGAVLGALLGAIAGIGVLFLFDNWRGLYEWVPMYDSTQPS